MLFRRHKQKAAKEAVKEIAREEKPTAPQEKPVRQKTKKGDNE